MYGKTVKLWFVNYPWDHLNRGLQKPPSSAASHGLAALLPGSQARYVLFGSKEDRSANYDDLSSYKYRITNPIILIDFSIFVG